MSDTAHGLRVEHLTTPLGITTPAPRLSWLLPSGAGRQVAYRLRAGNGWHTGPVSSDSSLLIPYAGPGLVSSRRVSWQVKVWTALGEHEWSAPSWFETGLLSPDDWTATWISPFEPSVAAPGSRPGYLLRGSVAVGRPVARARLYATGSAGWGDAVVIVPWQLYRSYGDERILAEMWPAMTAWSGRAAAMARGRRHPDRVAARPEAAAHEAYLWDSGFHWGEWLAPARSRATSARSWRPTRATWRRPTWPTRPA